MASPKSTTELRRFMGMVNQLGKFSPQIAELSKPMILSSKRTWNWGPAQEEAFVKVKAKLTAHTVLALYDPQADTKISADASSQAWCYTFAEKSTGMETSSLCFPSNVRDRD